MYLVFLDIDGVFTSRRVFLSNEIDELWTQFDPIAVQFMNSIHDKYPVKFVLISTWKEGLRSEVHEFMNFQWVNAAFRNAGFRGQFHHVWKTNPDNLTKFPNRAHEIKDFLELYGQEVKDFIIFDDNDYAFDNILGKRRLIRTHSDEGLLTKHMLNARSLMGNWDEK